MIYSMAMPIGMLHLGMNREVKISMLPINLESPETHRDLLVPLLRMTKGLIGTGFFTLHGAKLKAGETLRRPGPHIDGNYLSNGTWERGDGGGDWKVATTNEVIRPRGWGWMPSKDTRRVRDSGWDDGTGWGGQRSEGKTLTKDDHDLSYNTETGGMLIVSNYPGCKGWLGEFDGQPNAGGDCSHIKLDEGFILQPNVVYYANSRFIHETLPMDKDVNRVMLRITLPINHRYAA